MSNANSLPFVSQTSQNNDLKHVNSIRSQQTIERNCTGLLLCSMICEAD